MSKKISHRNRRMLLVVSMMMVVAMASVGVTVAWLTDDTTPIVNTFTASDINIELTETTGTSCKMIPGNTIAMDSKVTVADDSEDCYVFVQITETCAVEKDASGETYSFSDFLTYRVADGWTSLADHSGVYYREVNAAAELRTFSVFTGDQLRVNLSVTKAMLDKLTDSNSPKLTVQAFACQSANVGGAAAAWQYISDATPSGPSAEEGGN